MQEAPISSPHLPRPELEIAAQAALPTRFGTFDMRVFRFARSGESPAHGLSADHVALTMGDVSGEDVLVRVHSECLTSEVFGSVKCDCREQLEAAQARVAQAGRGIILYLRQEGRGIGLANKVKAYALQSHGHDTVDANRLLGLPDDARSYGAAAAMLAHLGVETVRLMTNNPAKLDGLGGLGVQVVGREPVVIASGELAAAYLETKRERMDHLLPDGPLAAAEAE